METKNYALQKMPVEDFINKVLIEEIGDIKDPHPYLAFPLICEGIEFLGKMNSPDSWEGRYLSKKHFNEALNQYDSLNKYKHTNLYEIIRCGFCHGLRPSSGNGKCEYYLCQDIKPPYRTKDGKKIIFISINQLYNDFKEACECLLKDRKSLYEHEELNNGFLAFKHIFDSNNEMVTVSGVTIAANKQNSNEINFPKPIKFNSNK